MKAKQIYLSGRMSGLPDYIWEHRFRLEQLMLELMLVGVMHENVKIINPSKAIIFRYQWLYKLCGYRFSMWYVLRMLKKCDCIHMVGNDWDKSRGARLERMKAREWGIEEI